MEGLARVMKIGLSSVRSNRDVDRNTGSGRDRDVDTNRYGEDGNDSTGHKLWGKHREVWPETPEEYAVLALRLQREKSLQTMFRPVNPDLYLHSHGKQLLQISKRIVAGFSGDSNY